MVMQDYIAYNSRMWDGWGEDHNLPPIVPVF